MTSGYLTLAALILSPTAGSDRQDLLCYRDADSARQPVRSTEDWLIRRGQILAALAEVMGPLPGDERRCALDPEFGAEEDLGAVVRRKVWYSAEPGDRVPAWLLLPKARPGRLPAVLCLHQTTAVGKDEPAGLAGSDNLHYALELAQRGYVTLAPDYPGYGEYHRDPYAMGYVSAMMKGIWNHRRALDLLQSLPEVAADRLGCIGHSLGGHNTLFLAVFDERVRVAVTSCGFNAFPKYYGGNLAGWSHAGYMPRIAERYGCDPARMPFDFPEILAAIAPRVVFVNAPLGDSNFEVSGVEDCLVAASPVFELLGGTLEAIHPDAGHDFPPAAREAAYAAIDRTLRP